MPHRDFPADHPRRLLAALGLSPVKRLGQNFLHDGNVARKIVARAVALGAPFLEIGPGLGSLTRLFAEAGIPAVAVEVHRGLAAFLRERYEGSSVEIVEADFLTVADEEWRHLFPARGTVVGNLPYSVSSPIILRLIELREIFPRAVLMLQKEMVARLCARPGGKEYGILSVYLGVLAEARAEFAVRRTCFTPSPDVDSAVMTVVFRRGIADADYRRLQVVVRAAFAQRRKTLRNAPVPFLGGGAGPWCDMLRAAGIDPAARAETVPPGKYLELARLLPAAGAAPGAR